MSPLPSAGGDPARVCCPGVPGRGDQAALLVHLQAEGPAHGGLDLEKRVGDTAVVSIHFFTNH